MFFNNEWIIYYIHKYIKITIKDWKAFWICTMYLNIIFFFNTLHQEDSSQGNQAELCSIYIVYKHTLLLSIFLSDF